MQESRLRAYVGPACIRQGVRIIARLVPNQRLPTHTRSDHDDDDDDGDDDDDNFL